VRYLATTKKMIMGCKMKNKTDEQDFDDFDDLDDLEDTEVLEIAHLIDNIHRGRMLYMAVGVLYGAILGIALAYIYFLGGLV